MKSIVKIANPYGSKYTSGKRALMFIRRGQAMLTEDGQLLFYTAAAVLERRDAERLDWEIHRYRSGIIFWNGDAKENDTRGPVMHRPGERRS